MKAKVILFIIMVVLMPTQFAKAIDTLTTIFSDDFERYAVDTFPYTGGWEIVYNGWGDPYQVITDAYVFSGTKSMQLWGRYSWSAVVQRKFTSFAQIIGFEANIFIEEYSEYIPGRLFFWNQELATWGKYYAGVTFYGSGTNPPNGIWAPNGDTEMCISSWECKKWYKIRLILDRGNNTYDIWVDDIIVASNFKIKSGSEDSYNISCLAIFSDWGGVRVYYDDVKVFAENVATLTVQVVGAQGQTLNAPQVVIKNSAGTIIFNGLGNEQGVVSIDVPYGIYGVSVNYKGFINTASTSVNSPSGTVQTITIDVFIEIFGQTMTFTTFILWFVILSLIILIPLVVVIRSRKKMKLPPPPPPPPPEFT